MYSKRPVSVTASCSENPEVEGTERETVAESPVNFEYSCSENPEVEGTERKPVKDLNEFRV